MTQPAVSFGCCDLGLKDKKYWTCSECEKAYHLKCLNTEGKYLDNWKCPMCLSAKFRGIINDNTPVRPGKRVALSPPAQDPVTPVTRDDVRSIIQSELGSFLSKINDSISATMAKELQTVKSDIGDLKNSMTFLGNEYEELKKMTSINNEELRKLQEENDSLKATVTVLSQKFNQAEQLSRGCNIEIQCVPESKSENLISLICQMCQSVGCAIKEESILNCNRVAKMNASSPRPRSIIVQLNSPRVRDSILAAVIKHNKSHSGNMLNTSHLGIRGEKRPIYVAEHLSAHNKALHAAARRAAKEKNYKFVWVRNGKIYMRKTDDSEFVYIRDLESIAKLK